MSMENVLVEHFTRLKCANFFILFRTSFDDLPAVTVNVRETSISIENANTESIIISLESIGLQLQINTLSLLIVRHESISFRINTSTSEHFHNEILPLNDDNKDRPPVHLAISIEPSAAFILHCDNCTASLTDSLCFRRILELPSDNMDLSEWFCHKPHDKCAPPEPSHTKSTASNTSTSCEPSSSLANDRDKYNCAKFVPEQEDLFYGQFFVMIDLKHFANVKIDADTDMIHCARCLKHVGERVKRKSAKIWNRNVRTTSGNDEFERIFVGNHTPFAEFVAIVERIANDFHLLGCQSQKLLCEAHDYDGCGKFLFIHVMAKNMNLYQRSNDTVGSHDNVIDLMQIDGRKCLFRCEKKSDQALLHFWQNDVNVVPVQLSIEMLNFVVERLVECSKFVPETFRMNNGFCLSYLSDKFSRPEKR